MTLPYRGQVLRLAPDGERLQTWGKLGARTGEFRGPNGIAIDRQRNVYVADRDNNRIQKLSPSGQPVGRWGVFGHDPGEFYGPEGAAVDIQGNVYVADTGNDRVQEFSPEGRLLGVWGTIARETPNAPPPSAIPPGEFRLPMGIAVDAQGNVYVADTSNHRIQKLVRATGAERLVPDGRRQMSRQP